jgi:hypothetical protein
MAHWRIHTLAYPVPQVFDAAVLAASDLGLGISQVDRPGLHLYLNQPGRLGGRDWPFDLTVTDSGLGTAVLRVSWEGTRATPWPFDVRGRSAGRLCSHIRALLGQAG